MPHTIARRATLAAVVGVLLVLTWHVNATVHQPDVRWVLPDLTVYRLAVAASASGQPVYLDGFGPANLPWLYPPFALLALAPLTRLSAVGAKVAISLLSAVALGVLCQRSWWATDVRGPWRRPLAIATFAVLLASEPMQQNLAMGQINVLLAALVLVDVLLPAGHPAKGLLVGLAAGIKLTPALVAVHYLLRRDAASAGRAAAAFGGSVVLGALAFPADSWTYWTTSLLATRIGPAHLGNQSLLGVMSRYGALLGADEASVHRGWFVVALLVAGCGVLAISRLNLDPLGTYCGLAALTLVVSPLSWTPHWIALAPMVVWLAARGRVPVGAFARLAALGLLLFAWPVDGVWSGLVWLVYPADYWSGAPAGVRTAGWMVCSGLYLCLAGATLLLLVRAGCVHARMIERSTAGLT
jgi:alpha-1,2-mannosyltransferase